MMIYEEVLKEFQKQRVKYVLVGGIAFNLLGGYRNTLDMDILLEMTDSNLRKVVKILRQQGYYVKQPVDPMGIADRKTREDWIKNKNMKAFNFYKSPDSYEEVDILVDSPVSFSSANKDAVKIKVGKLELKVISRKKFIKMKTVSGREKDMRDIEEIKIFGKKR